MSEILKVAFFLFFIYLIISWAIYNPKGAKKFKDDVDSAFEDSFKTVSDYVNSLDDKEE